MTTDEWVQLAFLMFLAAAVTMMVLAYWVRPHIEELRLDRDRWKAEAEHWREIQGTDGNVVEGVKLIDPADLAIYLKGVATDER